jgi:hypothetical protein
MERLDAYRIRKYIRRRVCRVYVASVRIIFYAIYAPYYIVYTEYRYSEIAGRILKNYFPK